MSIRDGKVNGQGGGMSGDEPVLSGGVNPSIPGRNSGMQESERRDHYGNPGDSQCHPELAAHGVLQDQQEKAQDKIPLSR